MPIHKVTKNGKTVGFQWGTKGKVYPTREAAEKQARAIYSQGYKPKK